MTKQSIASRPDAEQIRKSLDNNYNTIIYIRKDDAEGKYFWSLMHDEGTTGIGGRESSIALCLRSALPSVSSDYAVHASISVRHLTVEDYDSLDIDGQSLVKPLYASCIITKCNDYTMERCKSIADHLMTAARNSK